MGNTSALPFPPSCGRDVRTPAPAGPLVSHTTGEATEGGELPEPLERHEPVETAMRARGVVERKWPCSKLRGIKCQNKKKVLPEFARVEGFLCSLG